MQSFPHIHRPGGQSGGWGHGVGLVVTGAAIWFAPPALADDPCRDIAPSVQQTHENETSVLVATHKLDHQATTIDGDDLQPIPASSDQQPKLAEPQPTPAAPGGEQARADQQTVKVASKPARAPRAVSGQVAATPVFHGLQPGVSTRQELLDRWGEADEIAPTEAGQLFTYHLKNFRRVEVLVEEGLVALMRIHLLEPATPEALSGKIHADLSDAVEITADGSTEVLAYAFPEQGILLVLDEPEDITPVTTHLVSQMLLRPLDAEVFCLRADGRSYRDYSGRIADLEQALALDPHNAHAHWQLAEVLLEAGRASDAERAARQAVDLEPENIAYRQRWGQALAEVGNYDEAVLVTREVLDQPQVSPLVRGRALHQMGLLAARGDATIADKAISFHNMAISEADKLATSNDARGRRAAKRLLVEAHLAIAIAVSQRDYEDKLSTVAEWASRASGFAEEMIANDGGQLDLRVRVAEQSLAALANFKPANDPEPLIQEILGSIDQIRAESDDPLRIGQLEWLAGVAHLRAVEIEHHRRAPDDALEYANRAIELMSGHAEQRRDNPDTERLVGKLYFHIGAVHAVHKQAHAEAVTWYDRALPLVMTDTPEDELTVPRREGEALVSMAVSYWDQNERQRAVQLTEKGAALIEQAVAGRVVSETTLAVPYGNLAVMHRRLGNSSEAERFARLAEQVRSQEEDGAAPGLGRELAAKPLPKPGAERSPRAAANQQPRRSTQQRTIRR